MCIKDRGSDFCEKIKKKLGKIAYLVIVDLDLLEDLILYQAVEHGAVNLSEELASIERILRDNHETVVVNDVALNLGAVARQGAALQKKESSEKLTDVKKKKKICLFPMSLKLFQEERKHSVVPNVLYSRYLICWIKTLVTFSEF